MAYILLWRHAGRPTRVINLVDALRKLVKPYTCASCCWDALNMILMHGFLLAVVHNQCNN